MNRRQALGLFAGFVAGSPLWAQDEGVLGPVNVHEFEEAAKRKLHKLAYDFIAGGVEDELTLRANRQAFERYFLVPRVMTDVSTVDTSIELFGVQMETPIIIAPTGGKSLVFPDAELTVAKAALNAKVVCTSGGGGPEKVIADGQPLVWWSNTIGQKDRESAQGYARRMEDNGARAITITVDNQYQSNRDRNNRNRFDYGYMREGVPGDAERRKPVNPALPAMWQPHTPNLTWQYLDWLRGATKVPLIVKGILAPEDARLAVENGADGIIVSNHGGRQLDGAIASLDALPDIVDAVGGKAPVLMDGGIRRGSDILKALALGARAVLVGRAPLWGLGAFGQAGVERVMWMLGAELKLSLALAGQPGLRTVNRSLVRRL
ncbi:MAG: alpha-hydroxy-acid oxidizing protein [Bryobacterales bacterium]|nr:alpha-hydroxy-acid oxidizing protein [Bryobacterales bacterium]